MGIIKKLFGKKGKTDAEIRAEVLKKATEHMNANSELESSRDAVVKVAATVYSTNDQDKKKNIRAVLLEIAEIGETGILPISISDKTGVSQIDTASALAYLTQNKYAESVNSPSGMKYYLTKVGRKYCISKEFNS